jgi:hypothetical protein
VQYNIHQDTQWYEPGELIGLYLKELSEVTSNPRSYLVIPTAIPFNSQKVHYRQKLVEGINDNIAGECTYHNYQISNWSSFTWRYKLRIKLEAGNERLCYLYGDNVRRRLLFGDVPSDTLSVVEEVFMPRVFDLPIDRIGEETYADIIADELMETIAAKTVTIDHLHRYTDNRIRFDLVFDDFRYHFICSRRSVREDKFLTEFTIFFED